MVRNAWTGIAYSFLTLLLQVLYSCLFLTGLEVGRGQELQLTLFPQCLENSNVNK